jgi:hypothetical protein
VVYGPGGSKGAAAGLDAVVMRKTSVPAGNLTPIVYEQTIKQKSRT